MCHNRTPFRPRWASCIAVILALAATPAAAQDSFVRASDTASGEPVFSVLGTGLGLTYAAMALEMGCPDDGVWTMDLTGVRVTPGVSIVMGFGDPRGSFIAVPAIPQDFAEDRLRFTVARQALARALRQAQAEHPGREGSDLQVLLGGMAGLSIARDDMASEMAAFLRDCEPRRPLTTARR